MIPQIKKTLVRPRLVERLHKVDTHRVTLIAAPSGYGKTVAAAQAMESIALPVAWLTLTDADRDAYNFYYHALIELNDIAPGICDALPNTFSLPPRELAILVTKYLRSALRSTHYIFAIDDLHLARSKKSAMWLSALADNLPDNGHLLLISREMPHLSYDELLARDEIEEIRQDDLRMNEEEIASLADGVKIDDRLLDRLDGWPTGIMMAIRTAKDSIINDDLAGIDALESVFAHLAGRMMSAHADLHTFLFNSSTIRVMTPHNCAEALGMGEASNSLHAILNRNLFISTVRGGLVYHSLFRDYLQSRLKESDPKRFIALHRKAGEWMLKDGAIDEAYIHFMAAEDTKRAAEVANIASPRLFNKGQFDLLASWHSQINEGIIRAPELAINLAESLIYGDRLSEAEVIIDLMLANTHQEDITENLIAQAKLSKAWIDHLKGQHQKAISRAEPFLFSKSPAIKGKAQRIVGRADSHRGDFNNAIPHLEIALEIYRHINLPSALSHTLQDLQLIHSRLGNLEESSRYLRELVALRRKLGGGGALALALNNLGYHYHQYGDYAQALSTFHEALSLAIQFRHQWSEKYLLWSLADLHRDMGGFEVAEDYYTRAIALIEPEKDFGLFAEVLTNLTTLHRWQDAPLFEAQDNIHTAIQITRQHDLRFEQILAEVALLGIQIKLGGPFDALESLEALLLIIEGLRSEGSKFELARTLTLAANAALLGGLKEDAYRYLGEAVQIADQAGSLHPVAVEVAHTPQLETLAQGNASLSKVIKNLRNMGDSIRWHPAIEQENVNDTYSLRIYTLGDERVMRNGKIVPNKVWRTTVARHLFVFFVVKGSNRMERIRDAFWPEVAPKQGRKYFQTALFHIRQSLGKEVILYQNERYFINPATTIWVDLYDFQQTVEQARLVSVRDARAEDLWLKALTLYGGEFLPASYDDWTISYRNPFRDMYIESLAGAGACAVAREDHQSALDLFQKVFAEDPYLEDIHRNVLSSYGALGWTGRALDHYDKLKVLLRKELNISPEEETTRLIKSISRQIP